MGTVRMGCTRVAVLVALRAVRFCDVGSHLDIVGRVGACLVTRGIGESHMSYPTRDWVLGMGMVWLGLDE